MQDERVVKTQYSVDDNGGEVTQEVTDCRQRSHEQCSFPHSSHVLGVGDSGTEVPVQNEVCVDQKEVDKDDDHVEKRTVNMKPVPDHKQRTTG